MILNEIHNLHFCYSEAQHADRRHRQQEGQTKTPALPLPAWPRIHGVGIFRNFEALKPFSTLVEVDTSFDTPVCVPD